MDQDNEQGAELGSHDLFSLPCSGVHRGLWGTPSGEACCTPSLFFPSSSAVRSAMSFWSDAASWVVSVSLVT